MLRRLKALHTLDGDGATSGAGYPRTAFVQEFRQVNYLRLSRGVVDLSGSLREGSRQHYVLGRPHRRERQRDQRAVKSAGSRALQPAVLLLNFRAHLSPRRQVQVYRTRTKFAPSRESQPAPPGAP